MNYFTQSKWWPPLLVILFIVNIITISAFWWDKWHHPSITEHRPHPNGPANFLIRQLSFNERQVASFDSLRLMHQSNMKTVKPSIKEAKEALYSLLKQPTANDTIIAKSLERIGHLHQTVDKLTFEHFQQVRKLCTPRQQKIFDSIVIQAIKMMTPPPHNEMRNPK